MVFSELENYLTSETFLIGFALVNLNNPSWKKAVQTTKALTQRIPMKILFLSSLFQPQIRTQLCSQSTQPSTVTPTVNLTNLDHMHGKFQALLANIAPHHLERNQVNAAKAPNGAHIICTFLKFLAKAVSFSEKGSRGTFAGFQLAVHLSIFIV